MKNYRLLLYIFSLGLLGVLASDTRAVRKTNEPCPEVLSVRNGHRLVYDTGRRKTVLFGGADAAQVLGDLWEWDGRRWRCLDSTPALARTFPAFVYDSDRKRIVLFGGNRVLFGKEGEENTFLGDTREWDGRRWTHLEIEGPPARAEAASAYDRKRKRTVLFGGYARENGETRRFGDTWEFDGKAWKEMSRTGPSPRNGAAMIYDPEREKVILFGGSGRPNDTWEWDGKNWRRIETNEVEGIFNPVMAFDPKNERIVRFGGWNGTSRTNETWQFDGQSWKRLSVKGPAARNHSALIYDSARRRLVLFGGHDGENVFGDTWEFDGRKWIEVISVPSQKRVANGH